MRRARAGYLWHFDEQVLEVGQRRLTLPVRVMRAQARAAGDGSRTWSTVTRRAGTVMLAAKEALLRSGAAIAPRART